MGEHDGKVIAVVGATGLQGGALSRRLLEQGWSVRALTRNPDGAPAKALAALGAEVVQADSEEPASLERSFAGVQGVYSVQNHHIGGHDGEVRQGRKPLWLFERFTPTDETTMWRWLRDNELEFDTAITREVHPGVRTFREWLAIRRES